MTDQPTELNQAHSLDLTTDDGELLLYGLQAMLSKLALDLKIKPRGQPQEITATLDYLATKDPIRARLLRFCLSTITLALEEGITLLDDGIDWKSVEAFYCPPEDGFIDSPGHWAVLSQAEAQNARNTTASKESRAVATPDEFANSEEPFALSQPVDISCIVTPQPPRRASRGALRSLGRELRTECENEKRRFYAIARQHGLPTGAQAGYAIRAALSQMLGEPIASRKQLTARQWGLAASSIETQDLYWEAPAPKRQARAATCQDALRA